MKNKKITCFICGLSSGGAEHQISILSKLLFQRGYDVELVTFADVPDHYDVFDGIQRIRLAQGKSRIEKLFSIFKYFLLSRLDCVISFGRRENMLCLLPLIFRRNINVIAGERNFTSGRDGIWDKIIIKYLYRRANVIVPNSYAQRELLLSYRPEFVNKIKVVTNYTDLSIYQYAPSINSGLMKIGIFARYAPQKNYARFAVAVKYLKQRLGSTFCIEWYGNMADRNEFNEEYINFKNIVEAEGISDVLFLNNHIKDVHAVMHKFDAICLPSLWEGFSNSISEAICCGKPVLASNVSDNSIMVHDHINGFLFNPYDALEITEAMYKFMLLDKAEQVQMSKSSRRIAEQLFDKDCFIQSYISLIDHNN